MTIRLFCLLLCFLNFKVIKCHESKPSFLQKKCLNCCTSQVIRQFEVFQLYQLYWLPEELLTACKTPVMQSEVYTKQIRLSFFFRVTTREWDKVGTYGLCTTSNLSTIYSVSLCQCVPICLQMFSTIPDELYLYFMRAVKNKLHCLNKLLKLSSLWET